MKVELGEGLCPQCGSMDRKRIKGSAMRVDRNRCLRCGYLWPSVSPERVSDTTLPDDERHDGATEVALSALVTRVGPLARGWVLALGRKMIDRCAQLTAEELEEIAQHMKSLAPERAAYLGRLLR